MKKLKMQIKKEDKKEIDYYKLFNYILYQQNKRNRYNNNSNNRLFFGEFSKEKPIIIEHFVNMDYDNDYNYISLNNINDKSFRSKKYYSLDFKFKDRNHMNNISKYSISSKNSKINLSSFLSDIHYKKNFNKVIEGIWNKENNNYALNNSTNESINNISINKNTISEITKRKHNKNKIGLALVPKRIINRLSNDKKYLNEYYKKESNKLTNYGLRRNKFKKKKLVFENKMRNNSSLFNNRILLKSSNDMDQRNRFNKLKIELNEERNKINKMFSEFFKESLFNKFNKIDRIKDLKFKSTLRRARSTLSL